MNVVETNGITNELWRQLETGVEEDMKTNLRRVTKTYYTAYKNGPVAVLGVMPGSMISGNLTLWFSLLPGYVPSRSDLRKAKSLFEQFAASNSGYVLQAEVFVGDTVAERFAKFFGFQHVRAFGGRDLYVRK